MIICTGGCPTFQEEVNAFITLSIVQFSLEQTIPKTSLVFRVRATDETRTRNS